MREIYEGRMNGSRGQKSLGISWLAEITVMPSKREMSGLENKRQYIDSA